MRNKSEAPKGLRKLKSQQRRNKRQRIGERDGWKCCHCGTELTNLTMTLDHVIPVRYGGSNLDENLVASCAECNEARGREHVRNPIPIRS